MSLIKIFCWLFVVDFHEIKVIIIRLLMNVITCVRCTTRTASRLCWRSYTCWAASPWDTNTGNTTFHPSVDHRANSFRDTQNGEAGLPPGGRQLLTWRRTTEQRRTVWSTHWVREKQQKEEHMRKQWLCSSIHRTDQLSDPANSRRWNPQLCFNRFVIHWLKIKKNPSNQNSQFTDVWEGGGRSWWCHRLFNQC